ncbi:MAG: biotin synthase auxiliary protein BsaP [Sporichthyaceae bacterium]
MIENGFCDRCGEPSRSVGDPVHAACRNARELEPPRYCGRCRRRLVVQVTPNGWRARCVEHGEARSP